MYYIVFYDFTQYFMQPLTQLWLIRLLFFKRPCFIIDKSIVIASLFTQFNVIYEPVTQCIMVLLVIIAFEILNDSY